MNKKTERRIKSTIANAITKISSENKKVSIVKAIRSVNYV